MAGNGDAIIALDRKRMEATVKQDDLAKMGGGVPDEEG